MAREIDGKSVCVLAFGLIGMNLGFSEYVSVPMGVLTFFVSRSLSEGYVVVPQRAIAAAVLGLLLFLPPLANLFLDTGDLHSILFHCRELFFATIIIYGIRVSLISGDDAGLALLCAGVVVSVIVFLQFLQVSVGMKPLTVPASWMMLDYGNSLQAATEAEYEYIRPVALYSEPSVVASLLVAALYVSLKLNRWRLSSLFLVAIICAKSVFGLLGAGIVLIIFSKIKKKYLIMIFLLVSPIIVIRFLTRLSGVATGEDLSFQWRVTMPLALLAIKLVERPWSAETIDSLSESSKDMFEGASVLDNWPLFSVLRLGLWGILWVSLIFYVMPPRIRYFFVFLSVVSGAPLYHDKALLLIAVGCFAYHVQPVRNRSLAS